MFVAYALVFKCDARFSVSPSAPYPITQFPIVARIPSNLADLKELIPLLLRSSGRALALVLLLYRHPARRAVLLVELQLGRVILRVYLINSRVIDAIRRARVRVIFVDGCLGGDAFEARLERDVFTEIKTMTECSAKCQDLSIILA